MKPSTLRRLERFNKALQILKELKKKEKKVFLEDLYLLSVAERNIQIGVEFIIDISNAILAAKDIKMPETYKEVVNKASHLIDVDELLREKIQGLVGLRNIIVHMYADVKAELIYDNLTEIVNTLKEFNKKLLVFCKNEGIDP